MKVLNIYTAMGTHKNLPANEHIYILNMSNYTEMLTIIMEKKKKRKNLA